MDTLRITSDEIRLLAFKALAHAGAGHVGGSMSQVEILTVLYFKEMNIDPANPYKADRDRFVLSKGHAGPSLYATLAKRGYFPIEQLDLLDADGSFLPKHVNRKLTPGIDVSSGSLGQGLSVAGGIAAGEKYINHSSVRVYVILGDGECNEGQIWEAAMFASKYKLDNLVAILDRNNAQVDGYTANVMPMDNMPERWKTFGWEVFEINGHDTKAICDALACARNIKDKPVLILANTIKGKGLSFAENRPEWHAHSINAEQKEIGIRDLGGVIRGS